MDRTVYVRRAPHTGIRTFFTVAVSRQCNLEYYHTEILLCWNQIIYSSCCSCIGIIAFITVAVAEHMESYSIFPL